MSNTREVYIGNGTTINVTSQAKIKVFDINKALELYLENISKEFCMGMASDWFWTGTTIKSVMEIENFHLMASDWDVPVIEIDGERQDCYIEVDKYAYDRVYHYGYMRGIDKIDFWFSSPKLSETIHQLQYDDLKEMQKEIQAILEKYQGKRITDGMYNLDRPHTKKGKEIQEQLTDLQPSDSESKKGEDKAQ